MRHIPNILSFIRLLCVPAFILLFFNDHVWAACGIFVFASATDVLDGWLARRFQWITKLAKLLDPIADKANQITVLVCITIRAKMTGAPTYPVVLTVLIILLVKEFLMIAGGWLLLRKKIVVYALWYGKLATVLFFAVTLTLMLAPESLPLSLILCILLIAAILFALVMYYIKFFRTQFVRRPDPEKEN
ncbi:MAG: CDP-alcohol phosphatidyltransferase family protein [Clostridia bacterium]|nr:CDP-alcohol phosphatidyltransferase family protein [Clostridia bacterium]